eukprot:5886492-Alexandrium_andersonii.AAC.1
MSGAPSVSTPRPTPHRRRRKAGSAWPTSSCSSLARSQPRWASSSSAASRAVPTSARNHWAHALLSGGA